MSKLKSKKRLLFCVCSLLIACTSSAQQNINVSEAWVRVPPPGMQMLAGYGVFTNLSPNTVELVEAQSKSFESIGFHKSEVIDGISSMHKLDSVVLQPGESAVFEPGGKHLMIYTPQYEVQPESVQIEFVDKGGETYSVTFSLLKNAPE
ncbi:MAG: copper chaperone PCu(A)C [Proteobacteria bacterium]|jgi:periplasmic copper chaperone A|nr:copper chaperone PCu(A)C [Pseudomonadota bacterium]